MTVADRHVGLSGDALGQRGLPRPGEFLDGFRPACHRHQECFSGAADFWTVTVLPRDISGR
jgi:hypothetical protein